MIRITPIIAVLDTFITGAFSWLVAQEVTNVATIWLPIGVVASLVVLAITISWHVSRTLDRIMNALERLDHEVYGDTDTLKIGLISRIRRLEGKDSDA